MQEEFDELADEEVLDEDERARTRALLAGDLRAGVKIVEAEQARIDADALVAELTATAAQQNAAAESAASELESLEKGIDTASRRLRDLESKARKAQKKLDEVASAPPPEAAQWDVSAILERLYNVEVRQDKVEADGGKLSANSGRGTRDILERLAHLERATGAVVNAASRSAPPAAPAPLANP